MNSLKEAQDVHLVGTSRPENAFDVEVVRGPSFERLTQAIGSRLEQVAVKDGQLEVSLRGDIAWDSGVVSGTGKVDKDKAGLMLVARAATYAAARQRLSKETDLETVIASRDLDTASTWFTNRHPWFNNLEAKLRLRPISLRDALQQEPEKLVETLSSKQKTRRPLLAPSLATLAAAATACELAQPSPPAVVQTIEDPGTATAGIEATPTSFVATGPEATPVVAVAYPVRLGVAEVSELMAGAGGSLPEGFMENAEVLAIVETRRSWLRQNGFNVDNPDGSDYVQPVIHAWGSGDSFRWDVIPEDSAGNIVGWLQIADPNIQTGYRFAEGPSWDPSFNPQEDSFRFGLPQKLTPGNHFEVVLVGGEYRILVELDAAGNSLRWLNSTQQTMETLEGATIATATPEPTPTPELGGDQVRVAFMFSRGRSISYEMRPEVAAYLTPTTPEEWITLPVYTTSDGSRLPWGRLADFYSNNRLFTIFAARLRAMPMIPGHYAGGNMYFPVVEFPAVGGSNFYIPELVERFSNPNYALGYYPSSGFPLEWLESPTPLPEGTITWAPGHLGQNKIIELWRPHIGEMVLIMLPHDYGGQRPFIESVFQDLAAGRLMTADQPEFVEIPHLLFPAPP